MSIHNQLKDNFRETETGGSYIILQYTPAGGMRVTAIYRPDENEMWLEKHAPASSHTQSVEDFIEKVDNRDLSRNKEEKFEEFKNILDKYNRI